MKNKLDLGHYLACGKLLSDTNQIIKKIESENIEIDSFKVDSEVNIILKNLNDNEKLELLNISTQKFLELFPSYEDVFNDIKQEIISVDRETRRLSVDEFQMLLETISNNLDAIWSIILGLRLLGKNKLKINLFDKVKFEYEGKSEFLNLSKLFEELKNFLPKKED